MDEINSLLQGLDTAHEDQFSIYFLDPQWLTLFPLTLATLPAYFYLSSFYDKAANNEKTKEDLSRLKTMKGLEYVFEQPNPEVGIYHIRKQYRHNEKKTSDIALYYVHLGRIYQAPPLSAVLQTRLQNISINLQSSLNAMAKLHALSQQDRETTS